MNIIEEIRAFREIVLGKQDKLIPGDHIILSDDDKISVDFAPVDALLDRLEEVEDDINALNFDITELDIRLDAAEENIEDTQDHLDSVDYNINELNESLDDLKTKVDNIHGFEIVTLSEGQYDPETMKPTIEDPKTNILYLVPNDDPTQSNLWIEWLWIRNRWEQIGTAAIDLSEYVKKTDTPTAMVPGVVKVNRLNGVQLLSNGQLAITPANLGDIQSGQDEHLPITPVQQHNAVFYGLARASRTPTLYYNAVDKTNIRLMIDAGSHAQVENLANDVEEFGVKVAQLLNRTGETLPGMVWESKLNGAGWSEAAKGKVVDVLKDGESLMDEHGIVELPDIDVPTKTSDLQNDSGFLTEVPVATVSDVGGVKVSNDFWTGVLSNGTLYALEKTYNDYQAVSGIYNFISKGTLENVLTGRGYSVDVQINGTSIVDANKVANIPIPTKVDDANRYLIVKYNSGYGFQTRSDGFLTIVKSSNGNIDSRSSDYRPIVPTNMDYAIKAALTDGVGPAYTATEQSAARTRLGAASESDLEALENKVDALHGFEIVFLTTGKYDPETGIPTILGPQEGTLYLVPSGQASPDVWTEWLWTGEAWEKFGSSSIDLSNYVQKTDYATSATGGVIKTEPFYGSAMAVNGILRSVVKSYDVYNDGTHTAETAFISKGTLENVLAARIPDVPSISYDENEEMLVWQTTVDDGNEVSY